MKNSVAIILLVLLILFDSTRVAAFKRGDKGKHKKNRRSSSDKTSGCES